MKTSSFILSIFAIVFFLTNPAQALVDVRVTYGGLGAKSFVADTCGSACTGTLPSITPFIGLGGDVIVSPPLFPFGFGLRYEKLGISASASGVEVSAEVERIAAILNYRIIDTILKIGPIMTVGISNQAKMKVTESGVIKADYSSSTSDSASVGLEVGIKPLIVIPLAVGAEAGYQYMKIKGAKDTQSTNNKDIDLSGVYLKAYVGLSF